MSNSSLWPASNWEDFPLTRVGALLIDAVGLVAVILGFVIPRYAYKLSQSGVLSNSHFKRWGCWVAGVDTVSVDRGLLDVTCKRCCCSCTISANTEIKKNDITAIDITKRPLVFAGLAWAFFTSMLMGIWLHFIPCIWWTCDWGPYDGEGVRGGIWFVTWGIMFVVLCLLTRTIALKVTYKNEFGSEQHLLVSVAGGNAYREQNEKVARVYREMRRFAFDDDMKP